MSEFGAYFIAAKNPDGSRPKLNKGFGTTKPAGSICIFPKLEDAQIYFQSLSPELRERSAIFPLNGQVGAQVEFS